ncbi:hypothetical protein QTN25_001192 [Entamoeba marina]
MNTKDPLSYVSLYQNKKLKPKKISVMEADGATLLLLGKTIRIELNCSVLSRSIDNPNLLQDERFQFAFEIIYDTEYIIVCKTLNEQKYWVNKLSNYTTTWGTFGYSLNSAIKKSKWRFPLPLYRTLQYLFTHDCCKLEGIFRMSASFKSIETIKTILDEDQDVDMEMFENGRVAAALLKEYLRDLPEPLIPFDCYDSFINLPNIEVSNANIFIDALPIANQDTLWYLCSFLVLVILNKDFSLMDAKNLATCVGLSVSRPPPNNSIDELTHTKLVIASFTFLLDNYEAIFPVIKLRNVTAGMTAPIYPAVVPHPRPSFSQLATQIKQAIRKRKQTQQPQYLNVTSHPRLTISKSTSDPDLRKYLNLTKELKKPTSNQNQPPRPLTLQSNQQFSRSNDAIPKVPPRTSNNWNQSSEHSATPDIILAEPPPPLQLNTIISEHQTTPIKNQNVSPQTLPSLPQVLPQSPRSLQSPRFNISSHRDEKNYNFVLKPADPPPPRRSFNTNLKQQSPRVEKRNPLSNNPEQIKPQSPLSDKPKKEAPKPSTPRLDKPKKEAPKPTIPKLQNTMKEDKSQDVQEQQKKVLIKQNEVIKRQLEEINKLRKKIEELENDLKVEREKNQMLQSTSQHD